MENTMSFVAPSFRCYNRCNYDIGVVTANGRQYNIKPGSFALLTAEDIEYIDSICQNRKFFACGMLEAVDPKNEAIPLEKFNIVEAPPEERVLTEDEIIAQLKKPLKTMTTWLEKIEDPVELHAIYTVAIKMDLPASKLKVLNEKMPSQDWLDELG